jgi:hypothetical protein
MLTVVLIVVIIIVILDGEEPVRRRTQDTGILLVARGDFGFPIKIFDI